MDSKDSLEFKALSSELIIQILHCCEYPTILRFAATCKEYHELVRKSISLQLHIELEANGLELVKGSFKPGTTYSVILDDLKQFRDAWLDLDIEQPIARPLGESRMLLWELREGFYIKAFSHSQERLADALQFIPLDSETLDPPPLLFDFTFDEFTVDPGQELIACVSKNLGLFTHIHVDLCSMATGLAHPLAQHPRLTAEFDFERPFFSPGFAIEIMGNVVLAKVSHTRLHTYELLIWDWKSGNPLSRISSRRGICDFTFLDKQHLALLSGTRSDQEYLDTLELLVYPIGDDPAIRNDFSQGQLKAADLPVSRPILRLAFPQIKEGSKVSEGGFFLRSDPTPGRVVYNNSAAFACSYAKTLSMTFCFRRVNTGWEDSSSYRVFLDGGFLLDQLRNIPNKATLIPWSSWDFSSLNAGRFRDRVSPADPAALHNLDGGRDLGLVIQSGDLRQLEHNFYYLAVSSSPNHESFVTTVGADNPSIIHGLGFEEPITSRLPYRITFRTSNVVDHRGWQINGDCIVGLVPRGLPKFITIYKLKKRTAFGPSV
ncbi:hypothetical protein FRC11_005144 [Ceratobasidium sp. 423]|nr:hypothetical protein FRC11_005144 [Ceratobasidium sp. 423]